MKSVSPERRGGWKPLCGISQRLCFTVVYIFQSSRSTTISSPSPHGVTHYANSQGPFRRMLIPTPSDPESGVRLLRRTGAAAPMHLLKRAGLDYRVQTLATRGAKHSSVASRARTSFRSLQYHALSDCNAGVAFDAAYAFTS